MVCLRDAVVFEFQDVSAAIASINPSYGWDGLTYTSTSDGNTNSSAIVSGSAYDSNTVIGPYGNSVVAGNDEDSVSVDTEKVVQVDSVP